MERFWSKVVKGNGCWLWTACVDDKGYGVFKLGRRRLAHRVAYELANGPVPAGLHVLHSCDTPACVNPAHLRAGTNDDNIRDMVARGRSHAPRRDTKPRRTNTSGVLGVCRYNQSGGWRAFLKVPGGKQLSRHFRFFDDAVAQRRAWEAEYL